MRLINKREIPVIILALSTLCGSFAISLNNVNNDFLANINMDLTEIYSNSAVFSRGAIFYLIISGLSLALTPGNVVILLYTIAPVVHLILYRKIILHGKAIFIIAYVGFIYFGQSSYLLKMSISQIFVMAIMIYFARSKYLLMLFAPAFHLQSAVALFSLARGVSALIFNIAGILFVGLLIFAKDFFLGELALIDFYSAYTAYDKQESGQEISKVTAVLILYYFSATAFRVKPLDEVSVVLSRIIMGSIFLAIIFFGNAVVTNRILDFCWVFILAYLSRLRLSLYFHAFFMAPMAIFSIYWGVGFLCNSILNPS